MILATAVLNICLDMLKLVKTPNNPEEFLPKDSEEGQVILLFASRLSKLVDDSRRGKGASHRLPPLPPMPSLEGQ